MSQMGMGAIIHYLSGGSKHSASEYYGKKIVSAKMENEQIRLELDDGVSICIWDNGQACCESRYMTTDDDVQSPVGHKLIRIEAKDGPNLEGSEEHESCFVEIGTDDGFVTIVNHVEHNGYYGGFGLTITQD